MREATTRRAVITNSSTATRVASDDENDDPDLHEAIRRSRLDRRHDEFDDEELHRVLRLSADQAGP